MASAILSKLNSEIRVDKRKQIIVIAALWVMIILLTFSVIDKIKNKPFIVSSIPQEDIQLKEALMSVQPITLPKLIDNIKYTMKLQDLAPNVSVKLKYDKKEADNDASPVNLNLQKKLDRIGEHVDATILIKGDLFEQILLLKKIESDYNNFILIKTIKGDNQSMTIEIAIYGKK